MTEVAFFVGMFLTPPLISQSATALTVAIRADLKLKESEKPAWAIVGFTQFLWALAWTIVYGGA